MHEGINWSANLQVCTPEKFISAPVIAIFEAKDDNIDNWMGQCGAEMVAARLFNQQKHEPIEVIYGAVTNGYEWLFLRLEGQMLLIDTERYGLENCLAC